MKNIIIIGAGGFGRECYAIALACIENGADFIVKGFLDDNNEALNGYANYPKIIGKLSTYEIEENDAFVCAIGNPKTKEKCTNMIPVFKRKKSKLQEFLSHQIRLQLECMVSKLCDILAYVSDKETVLGEVELSMLREELDRKSVV